MHALREEELEAALPDEHKGLEGEVSPGQLVASPLALLLVFPTQVHLHRGVFRYHMQEGGGCQRTRRKNLAWATGGGVIFCTAAGAPLPGA